VYQSFKLAAVPALSGRRLLVLLAAMSVFCLRGKEKSKPFACLFLQRLPRELRPLLTHKLA
jgi:hypothetical protein